MSKKITEIVESIRDLQRQLEAEFEEIRGEFSYSLHRKKIIFDEKVKRRHKTLKTQVWTYVRRARFLTMLTAPIIYAVIIPIILLDFFVTIYQAICFPVYGIPKVQRSEYIMLDHVTLQYLNMLEKLNCVYCSYSNGLLAYSAEIAARTEQYWCPIKHSRRVLGSHHRYPDFLEFGDGEGYHEGLQNLRNQLKNGDQS